MLFTVRLTSTRSRVGPPLSDGVTTVDTAPLVKPLLAE